MKKLLWLLFVALTMIKVEASEVFYSDYTEFSPYQEEVIKKDDCTNIISEERYRWYKNEQILKGYIPYNETDTFTNNCYLTQPSDWSTEKIENVAYVYETRTKYEYTKAKKARYIHLYDLQGSYGAFRITELAIMVNGEEIDYSFTCEGCWENFEQYINNGIYDENKSYIDNGGSLVIDLGQEYPLNQIDIVFYIFDLGPNEKLYTLIFADSQNNTLAAKSYNLEFADQYWVNALKIETNIYDLEVDTTDWTYSEISYQNIIDDSIIDTIVNEEYRYQVKWCRPYEIVKVYYPEYSKDTVDEYPIRDEDSKKTFYSYQKRDKLELDIFEITSKDFDLNNFVVTSTDEVVIIENINWDKNGDYEVVFKLNDIEVTKSITLNIAANTIEELEVEIDMLHNQLEQLIADFNHKANEYEQKIADLNQQLNNCNLDNECLNKMIKEKDLLLIDYEKQILDLSDNVNRLQVTLKEKINRIDILSADNEELIFKVDKLKDEIENFRFESANLNQELINNYEAKINNLVVLNDFYKNKVAELEGDLSYLNENFGGVIQKKDLLIKEYSEQITILKEQLDIKDYEYQQIKNNLKDSQPSNDLSNKLDSYILRINNKTLSYVLVYLWLLVLIIYLIYRWRKRSKKK